MDGEQFYIHLTDNAKPICVTSPRSIPFTYCDKLAAELELLQQQYIIAQVSPNDSICILSHLTRFVQWEKYQSCSPAKALADMAASNEKFTVLDARKGYYQCSPDAESQLLTTFITPFCRFRYLRAPTVHSHSLNIMTEAWQKCSHSQDLMDFEELSMMYSYMTENILPMSELSS